MSRRGRARRAWILAAAAAAVACGASTPSPEPGTGATAAPAPPPPLATRDEIDLRGPLIAMAVDGAHVRVVARTAEGGTVAGVATVRDDRWLPETLRFAPVDEAERGQRGPRAVASAEGVVLERDGQAPLIVRDRPAHAAAAAARGDGTAVAFADDDGVHLVTVDATGALSPPRLIDDGRRPGEPAHRVGAALALSAHGDTLVLAYQNQTLGTVVLTPLTGDARPRDLPTHGLTRGMHIALVTVGPHLFILDLAARASRLTLLAERADLTVHTRGSPAATLELDT